MICLDSWAVLRFLEGVEPAATYLEDVFDQKPVMSWINLGEVYYVVRREHRELDASETIRDLHPFVTPDLPNARRVLEAAEIKAKYRLSYADAFAAATAVAHQAVLLTGDPELLIADAPWKSQDLRALTSGRAGP
ncbi:MAG: PIN domain-containing protein [Egibacteraceae bacterium]